MKPLLTMLMVVTLTMAALAQYSATTPTVSTTTGTAVCPTTGITCPAPVATCPAPCATCPAPCATCPAPYATCPAPVATYPAPVTICQAPCPTCPAPVATCPAPGPAPAPCIPCPAISGPAAMATPNLTGDTMIMVLGSEEIYALNNLPTHRPSANNVAFSYNSIFTPDNPLTSSRPNLALTRHGNPYYPYYSAGVMTLIQPVATTCALNTCFPSNINTACRDTLSDVTNRYCGMTVQQATCQGYQPVGAYDPCVGQLYVNQQLVDNTFNPQQPEALIFDQCGKLLGVRYILLANEPYTMFDQQMEASSLACGAQQLTVWLFASNPNGMFAATNPGLTTPGYATTMPAPMTAYVPMTATVPMTAPAPSYGY